MAMKKSELRELYLMMFPEYPDIVNITQLQSMLGISRHLAYDLINDGYIRGLKIGNAFRIPKVNVIEYVMDQGKSAISSLLCNCDGDVRFGVVSVSLVPAESRLKSGFFAQKVLRDGLF